VAFLEKRHNIIQNFLSKAIKKRLHLKFHLITVLNQTGVLFCAPAKGMATPIGPREILPGQQMNRIKAIFVAHLR
jgi:hypothetical protein